MTELYIHIPFCIKKCTYCDFTSFAGQDSRFTEYVQALLDEATFLSHNLNHPQISTLYIGGGTPSVLPCALFEALLKGLHEVFDFSACVEATVECNPGTLTNSFLQTAKEYGINRISMGMQAKQPELLKTLGRIHDWNMVRSSADLIHKAGFTHLNLDLMFGLPGQTVHQWRESVECALSLHPDHLSCYGLIPEDGTPLKCLLDQHKLSLPEDEEEREMYNTARDILSAHAFRQYEISNFAIPGNECRHNIGYWKQVPYIGLGCSAASLLMPSSSDSGIEYYRKTNPSTLDEYFAMLKEGHPERFNLESISRRDAMFETMMLGLRMNEGVSEQAFLLRHGIPLNSVFGSVLMVQEQKGLILHDEQCWKLTRRGMDVQNTVLVELLECMEKHA